MTSAEERRRILEELARPYQDKRNDEGHSDIVIKWAGVFLKECRINVDSELVLVAALLHDIGWSCLSSDDRLRLFEKNLSENVEFELRRAHETEGARLAARLMNKAGYEASFIEKVQLLIDGHDTRNSFMSPEDGILQDSDTLWMFTNQGFEADMKRRNLSHSGWGEILRNRFQKAGAFYTKEARSCAFKRLGRLEIGKTVSEPGDDECPRVLICHYRVGWTDGVSLEIEKRQEILEEMGFKVALLAGPGSRGADYIIPELDFDTEEARLISRNAFGGLKDFVNEEHLLKVINDLSATIEEQLKKVLQEWDPDFVLLHNIFSHGRHIASARAFCRCLKELDRPSLTTHHDFYWERDDFREPSGPLIQKFLDKYVPPVIPKMRHAVINSLAARKLLNKKGIDALIFPDTLDFSVDPWVKDNFNSHLPSDFSLSENDIFILQATRIVRRKGIELIPPLLDKLNTDFYMDQLRGRRLYNGKLVTDKSRFVFILAGYAEQEAEEYKEELKSLMKKSGLTYCFMRSRIAAERQHNEEERIYSLFDTYPYADLVSYPSIFEGWGNQFIEALFARKPVIVHEYPVYKSDIKPKGYQVISLGGDAEQGDDNLYSLSENILKAASQQVIDWLLSPDTNKLLDKNYELARSNNSYDYLRALMRRSMEHYEYI